MHGIHALEIVSLKKFISQRKLVLSLVCLERNTAKISPIKKNRSRSYRNKETAFITQTL